MTGRQGALTRVPATRFARKRVVSAFALGAALAAAGLIAGAAGAHGPFVPPLLSGAAQPAASIESVAAPHPHTHFRAQEDASPREAASRVTILRYGASVRHGDDDRHFRWPGAGVVNASIRTVASLTGGPVCVRLCDGYFFPLTPAPGDAAAQGAACNSLCPDAPTEVFYRNGSDNIEDALSATGKRYSALPVGLRYRTSVDNACSCHRDVVAYAPLHDATLRRGDAIMTPAGFVVFHGAEGGAHVASDFAALAAADVTPSSLRPELQAMERASVERVHPSLGSWLSAQAAPPAAPAKTPAQVVARVTPVAPVSGGGNKFRLVVWHGREE